MHLASTRLDRSPEAKDRVRMAADVVWEDGTSRTFWYDVAEKDAEWLGNSGNPWAAALLPMAVLDGERLQIDLPVDRLLYENLANLKDLWCYWYPDCKNVPLTMNVVDDTLSGEPGPTKVALFYSGGVDSSFSLVKHVPQHTPDAPMFIQELVFAGGYEILLSKAGALTSRRERNQAIASAYGFGCVYVTTNLRDDYWRSKGAYWGGMACAAILASIGLLFEKKYRRLILSSSLNYGDAGNMAYGSHPAADHFLSTRHTHLLHYGAATPRAEKILAIAQSEPVMQSLHVCWHHEEDYNCGACTKCFETMIGLELAGALKRASRFPDTLDMAKVQKIFYANEFQRYYYQELFELAKKMGRQDVVDALQKSFEWSRDIHELKRRGDRLTKLPLLWRLARPLRRRTKEAIAGSIRQFEYHDKRAGIDWGELKV